MISRLRKGLQILQVDENLVWILEKAERLLVLVAPLRHCRLAFPGATPGTWGKADLMNWITGVRDQKQVATMEEDLVASEEHL